MAVPVFNLNIPDNYSVQYLFDSIIKVIIYDDLFINFSEIAEILNI